MACKNCGSKVYSDDLEEEENSLELPVCGDCLYKKPEPQKNLVCADCGTCHSTQPQDWHIRCIYCSSSSHFSWRRLEDATPSGWIALSEHIEDKFQDGLCPECSGKIEEDKRVKTKLDQVFLNLDKIANLSRQDPTVYNLVIACRKRIKSLFF